MLKQTVSCCRFTANFVWLSKWCKIQHFKILFIFSIYSFIFKHLYLFSITICSKFDTYIYIQQFYLFPKLLSIQKLFIHSTTFYSLKIYCASLLCMEVTYFLQWMNRGLRRSASDHWNFEKIPTAFALSSVRKGSADPNI